MFVSVCSNVKTRSPTKEWDVLMLTFKSPRVPGSLRFRVSKTPLGSPSGMLRLGLEQRELGVGVWVEVGLGVGV